MIVTLAGHVDHGKTSLVRALTGVDTDRLAQEKARGLTIDLGFAYIDGGTLGFVDVPGHHKFIHNMVAGVAQHQHALLVIAADDGPMPQSREHLDILKLTGIQQGCIALTKCDLVDPTRLAEAEAEIANLTAGTFLADAPVFRTAIQSTESNEPANSKLFSTEQLLDHLRTNAAAKVASDTESEKFRLAVDRSFIVKGIGTVVTGTVHSGRVTLDQNLHVFPGNNSVRVKSIRTQDTPADEALPGERCALNLSGIDAADITRGAWLTGESTPNFVELSVELDVLPHFPRAIKHWTPVHIYHATSHCTGRIALLNSQRIEPGQCAVVDIVCDTPMAAQFGDQLIIRDFSLDLTLGGGRVIYAQEDISARRRNAQRTQKLQAYQSADHAACMENLLALAPVHLPTFTTARNLTAQAAEALADSDATMRVNDWVMTTSLWQGYLSETLDAAKQHAEADPTSAGSKENYFTTLPTHLRSAVLNHLVSTKQLIKRGALYTVPDQVADLPEQLKKLWQLAERDLSHNQAPSTGDLAKQWKIPQHIIDAGLQELTKRGFLVHIAKHRFYLPAQLHSIASGILEQWQNTPFTVRDFRDATGIGRNVAIEILEYFDSRGFTRRRENERVAVQEQLKL